MSDDWWVHDWEKRLHALGFTRSTVPEALEIILTECEQRRQRPDEATQEKAYREKVEAFLRLLREAGVQDWRGQFPGEGNYTQLTFFPTRGAAVEAKEAIAPQADEVGLPPLPTDPMCPCGHSIFQHNGATGLCFEACEPAKCKPQEANP